MIARQPEYDLRKRLSPPFAMRSIGEEMMNEERQGGKAQLRRAEDDGDALASPRPVGSFQTSNLDLRENIQLSSINEDRSTFVFKVFHI
jgi:hypothetical protein